MRPSTPILALTASLPLLTTAQLGADETICSFLYGTAYTDACCHSVISRGASAPCTDIEYVGNLTLCSTRHYPTGWAVCVEKEWDPSTGPLFGHAPSGIVTPDMSLEELEQVYWDWFSSNTMGEGMAAAVAKIHEVV